MFSRKVFCGATSPLFPPGILLQLLLRLILVPVLIRVEAGIGAVVKCEVRRSVFLTQALSESDGAAHCNRALWLLSAH